MLSIKHFLDKTQPDLWREVRLAEDRLESGLKLLGADQPQQAIEVLESIRDVELGNEHYMIKRSVALRCAYQAVGNIKASRDAMNWGIRIAMPSVAWETPEWWGDVKSMLRHRRASKTCH